MMKSCPPQSTSEASREEQARNLCLRLLTARARTRAELEGQLAKRGYPDDVSARVLDRLARAGLVDDVDFAEQWVRSRRANAGKGKRALAAELRTKGLDDDDTKVARRLVGMLARRGYSQTMAFDVVKGELAGERERRRV